MEKVTAYLTRLRNGVAQLLVFRDPGHADFGLVVPGGTVEQAESLEHALLREVREESGLESVRVLRHLGTVTYADAAGTPVVRHYFHGIVDGCCPDAFIHVVASGDGDDGWICRYFWLDVDRRSPPNLGGRLGDRLEALLRFL